MIVNLKSGTDLAGFYIIYEGSTNLEKAGWYGISHLLEHLVCRSFEHLRETFEREGIDWNAYTSNNEIVFYFTGLEENLNKRREQILDLMTGFTITKEQFENERKIVLQEYTDYFSNQRESHMLNLSRKLFKDYDPIGLRSDLESMRYIDCLNFFELQFMSPTKIINVSPKSAFKTDIDFSDRKIVNKIQFGPFDDVQLEKMNDYGDKASLIAVSPIANIDFNYINFINSMLSHGLSSPLYTEVREKKGLVYHIGMHQSRINNEGITTIVTQTNSKSVDAVWGIIRDIMNNPDKFLTKERFETIRDWYIIKHKKEKINRYANVNMWINPKGWSMKEIIDTITYEKVRDVYDSFYNFDKFYLSYDKEEFNK